MTAPEAPVAPRNAEVLTELRLYRAAEEAMRRRTRDSMNMGENDLAALRFLLKAQSDGRIVTPGALAEHLGMKSASVTVMLDRLTKSGHLARMPHPTDRRSLAVVATSGSDDEVRQTLGAMHSRMLVVARRLDDSQASILNRFLNDMSDALDIVV